MAARTIYKDKAGKRLSSVTTILSRFKESGGLMYWANQQGLEGKTLQEARVPAASAGTLAHDMVEAHLNKRDLPSSNADVDIVANAEAAFKTYLKWEELTKVEVQYTEVSLVSERFRFGGRLDAMGLVGNELVLIDWKTSNSVYADYLYQMAAYAILWEENYPDSPITGGFHLCRFAKDHGDFAHHYYKSLEEEKEIFLIMRGLFDRCKLVDKRAR